MNDTMKYIQEGLKWEQEHRKVNPCCECNCGCMAQTFVNICRGCRIGYHIQDAERDAGL